MAFSIRNLKIRDQIFLVSLPPLLVLLCGGALFFYAYWILARTNQETRRCEDAIAHTQSALQHLTEMHLEVSGYLLNHRRPSSTAALENEQFQVALEDLAAVRRLESKDEGLASKVDGLRKDLGVWQSEWAAPTLGKLRRREKLNSALTLEAGQGHLAPLQKKFSQILEVEKQRELDNRNKASGVIRRLLFQGLTIVFLLALALLLVTRAVTRIITQPVLQLIDASEQVSQGDFQPSLPSPVDNEFGILSRSFSRMTSALREEREEMATLNRFSEAVTQCTSEQEVYNQLLHVLKDRFHPSQVIIFILNASENYLEAVASLIPLPESLRGWPVIEEPHSCKAVRMGRPFRVDDVSQEPPCPSKFALPTEGFYYCGPLIAGGIIIGAVRLEAAKQSWKRERETLLESYLSGAASALSNLRLLETMKQQANVDILTGLYNRRFLEDYARKLIAMARRREQPLAFIMMDLDHFKQINDVYGHEAGDRVLRHFAKTITSCMRETNLAARLGGEEFVVLLPDTGAKEGLGVGERIRQAVARMAVPSGSDKPLPPVTVSLGIAVFPGNGGALEEVLQAADKALYESKRSGRNRCTLYVEPVESTS